MKQQHKEGGTLAAAKQVSAPADEHGSERDFIFTRSDLKNADYNTAPLRASLGDAEIARQNRVLVNERCYPQDTAKPIQRQLADSPILESA